MLVLRGEQPQIITHNLWLFHYLVDVLFALPAHLYRY